MNSWLGTTWLIAARELRQGARARSFRIVTVLLVAAVAAAILIPAALHGHRAARRRSASSAPGRRPSLTVRTAARITGTAVQTVPFASLGEAEAALRDGNGGGRARPRARSAHPPHSLRGRPDQRVEPGGRPGARRRPDQERRDGDGARALTEPADPRPQPRRSPA